MLSSQAVSGLGNPRIIDISRRVWIKRNYNLQKQHKKIGSHTTLLHFVVITLIPIIWIFDIALSPGNALGGEIGDSFTDEHFTKILEGESFWIWFRNSLIVSIGTSLLGVVIAIPAGYAFSRYKFTGRDVSMFAFLLVQMFPGIIIIVPYFLVMKTLGLLNSHLGSNPCLLCHCSAIVRVDAQRLLRYSTKRIRRSSNLGWVYQSKFSPKVVLPLSLPAVAIASLVSFAAWNEFLLAHL